MTPALRLPALAAAVLAGVVVLADAWGGWGSDSARAREVLDRLTADADILINLDPGDLPSTTDMIRLGKRATPAVINGLVNNMSEEVRVACAAVLTATRDPRALQALMDALDDPDGRVRYQAVRALGHVESRAATKRLLALLDKRGAPGDLVEEAVVALGRLGDPAAVKPLLRHFEKTWDSSAQRALWDLRRHLTPAQVQRVVLAPLRVPEGADPSPGSSVLEFAVERAGDLKLRAAAQPLMRLLDREAYQQNRIVYNLGRIGDRAAIPVLKGLLDRTAEARLLNNVVFALERLGEDPKPFLRDALADRRAYIRFNAAFVVGDLGAKAMVPELARALSDPNDFVRGEAAVALGKLGSPDAVPALEEASREKNPIVRRDALLALAHLDYAKYRPRVLDELVTSTLGSVRGKAIRFLAGQGDAGVMSTVLASLDPDDYSDRDIGVAALDRFWKLDNPDATAFLVRLAADGSHRHDALRLLGRLQDERAHFLLRQWLHAPVGEQDQILRALARFGDAQSAPLARRWLADKRDISAQLHAAFLLASLGESAGADHLLAAIEDTPVYLKRVAARLLTELDLKKVDGLEGRLVAMLDHADVYVRIYAARALLERGDERAFDRLWQELDKRIPFIRDEALDVFERAPKKEREKRMGTWMAKADAHLRRELRRIRERN